MERVGVRDGVCEAVFDLLFVTVVDWERETVLDSLSEAVSEVLVVFDVDKLLSSVAVWDAVITPDNVTVSDPSLGD
jgi:hypothetical protein